MAVTPKIQIQHHDFDIATEISALTNDNNGIGATVTFIGHCRDENERLTALELEHYPGMAEAEINRIADEAIVRFKLCGLTVIHRYGTILPGQNIVIVIAAASHRHAAFEGASYVMDFLKTAAPFWKKEHLKNGDTGGWVSARESDETSKKRWQ